MTTENLCLTPKPDEPHVLCMGPKGHRVTTTMHGNGDLRWWDGAQPDAGAQDEGVAYASPTLAWLEEHRGQQVLVEPTGGEGVAGYLARILVEPDADNVLHPEALVITRASGTEVLVPWHAVTCVHRVTL